MFRGETMYNPYNLTNGYNMNYINDLQNMRDRIDKQLQMVNQTQPQTTPITQNFQIAPNNNNTGIKYVNSVEDVKKELVFDDTLFINKERTILWFKNALGDVKTYQIVEIVEKDPKDAKIEELEQKISMLMEERENEKRINTNDDGATSIKRSTNGKSN